MIYWKFRFHFGKTTPEGLKKLQSIEYRIKAISFIHYQILSFIKYLFMILLTPLAILGMLLITVCKIIIMIINKPVDLYVKYFLN